MFSQLRLRDCPIQKSLLRVRPLHPADCAETVLRSFGLNRSQLYTESSYKATAEQGGCAGCSHRQGRPLEIVIKNLTNKGVNIHDGKPEETGRSPEGRQGAGGEVVILPSE
jgi:hypothetical protein